MILHITRYLILLGVMLMTSLNASAFFAENSINNVFGECIINSQQNNTKVAKQRTKQTFTLSETTNASRGVSFSYRSNNINASNSINTSEANASYKNKATNTMSETGLYAQTNTVAFDENIGNVFTSNAQQRSMGGIGGGSDGFPANPPITPITDVPLCFLALLAIGYTIYRKQTKTNAN